jgi:hypothetical protein
VKRSTLSVVLFASAAVVTGSESRADEKQACIISYEQAQHFRKDGKLRAAREQLLACNREVCPGVLRSDCAQWLTENDRNTPSVIIEARGPDDRELVDVRVTVDRELVALSLNGKAMAIDPGSHKIRFEYRKLRPVEQQVVVREGEKDHRILVRFEEPSSAPTATEPSPAPSADVQPPAAPPPAKSESNDIAPSFWAREPPQAYALAGAGVVATALYAYFGLSGLSARASLDACKPYCDRDQASAAKSKLLAADISLLAGLAAFGGAVWVHFNARKSEPAALGWYVAPVTGGAEGGVGLRY